MIYCFGDSWGYGSELNFEKGERPFVEHFNRPFKNFSSEGNSYPVIVLEIFNNVKNIKKDDIVLIVIPPDVRWIDEENGNFISWWVDLDKKRYISWLGSKTEVWFKYHVSLFTYSIQSILDKIGCKYLFMHNYGGEFIIDKRFKSLIKVDNFLNIKKSLTTLLGGDDIYSSWDLKNDGPKNGLKNKKYFEGTHGHPNELGHKKIVKLIKNKLNF